MKQKLNKMKRYLENIHFDPQEETVENLIISLLSGTPLLLISKPGNGKSSLMTEYMKFFPSGFSISLGEDTGPNEIFGPLNIKSLTEGIEKRDISQGCIGKDILFFDEADKASDEFYGLLLEQIENDVYINGEETIKMNSLQKVFAVNRLFNKQKQMALLNRIAIKHYIPDFNYLDLIELQNLKKVEIEQPSIYISPEEALEVQSQIKALSGMIFDDMKDADKRKIEKLISVLNQEFSIAPRKLIQVTRVTTAYFWYEGQNKDEIVHLFAKAALNILWDDISQIPHLFDLVRNYLSPDYKEWKQICFDFHHAVKQFYLLKSGEKGVFSTPLIVQEMERIHEKLKSSTDPKRIRIKKNVQFYLEHFKLQEN